MKRVKQLLLTYVLIAKESKKYYIEAFYLRLEKTALKSNLKIIHLKDSSENIINIYLFDYHKPKHLSEY